MTKRVRPSWSFLTEDEVRARLHGLEVEEFDEQEEDRRTAFDGTQHWHAFWLIARKPAR